ncbi:peritrophin-1-like [Pieris rapae]|uniref:peritrophin-1-like n=1 Tax=Pieris rapae TaxID=64459 RepID=UPI001E27B8F8|nr:peritrophin-1-like [Pieris rapae]
MKVAGLLFLAVATLAQRENPCPPEQAVDWTIEKLFAHEDCNKFYQCTHGYPVERICPAGLHFNEAESICDWPINVNCQPATPPETETDEPELAYQEIVNHAASIQNLSDEPVIVDGEGTEVEVLPTEKPGMEFLENGCPVDPYIHWLVSEPENCGVFYSCVWGNKVARSCPPNLHFNKELQVCDWPVFAGCIGNGDSTAA